MIDSWLWCQQSHREVLLVDRNVNTSDALVRILLKYVIWNLRNGVLLPSVLHKIRYLHCFLQRYVWHVEPESGHDTPDLQPLPPNTPNPTFLLTCSWHAPVHYDPNQSSHIHLQETSMNLWELMLRQVDCQVVNFFLVACIKYFLCCNRLHCLTLFLTSLHPCMSWTTACTKKANIVFKYSLSTFGKIPTDLKQLALCRWKPIPCVVL